MQTFVQVLNILFILGISWWIWKQEPGIMRKFFWPALAAKLSAGILVGIIYAISYTTSDTFSMFEWALELSLMARTDLVGYFEFLGSSPEGYFLGIDRTIFFVKITSLFALLTYDNYWIASLYFSFISFLAAWRLTKIVWQHIPRLGVSAAIAFLFFPSCVFWASGIIKESLAMAGLFYLASLFLQVWFKHRITVVQVLAGVFAIWIVWNLKYYYIGLFIPILLATWFTRKITETRSVNQFSKEVTIWFSIVLLAVFVVSFGHPNFSIHKIADVLASNNEMVLKNSNPDDIIQYYKLTTGWSIFINAPLALISGLFRPFIWEANTMLKILAAVENLFLLSFSIVAIKSIGNIKNSPNRVLIMAILTYCLVLCLLLSISSPNFGTLVRYRIGFLPFLVMLLASQRSVIKPLAKLFNVYIAED